MPALVLCARKDSSDVVHVAGQPAAEKPCQGGCGATLIISASSLALPNAEFFCNDCGNAKIRSLSHLPSLGIAPGSLQAPGDEARREELLRMGFRDLSPEEVSEL